MHPFNVNGVKRRYSTISTPRSYTEKRNRYIERGGRRLWGWRRVGRRRVGRQQTHSDKISAGCYYRVVSRFPVLPRFYVQNFGCRATQADGAALERQFEELGLERSSSSARAEIVVLNTCTVTASADQDARAAIRRVHRENPAAQIVVTGCYAQRAPQELAALPGVAQVIGNSHKHELARIALDELSSDDLSSDELSFRAHQGTCFSQPAHARDLVPLANLTLSQPPADDLELVVRSSSLVVGEEPVVGPRSSVVGQPQPPEIPDRMFADTLPILGQEPFSACPETIEETDNHQPIVSRGPTIEVHLPILAQRPSTIDQRPIFVSDIFAHTDFISAPVFDAANERTRPNLKVQDGCNNRCSFCVIPYVRGQSRSLALDRVIDEVNALVAAGYRELVISGINLGRWGRDMESSSQLPATSSQLPDHSTQLSAISSQRSVFSSLPVTRNLQAVAAPLTNRISLPTTDSRRPTTTSPPPATNQRLATLIRAILDRTSLEKLRISSVEPMDWTDELISLIAASPRIARHAHVPLQSGSDAVLRRMHRKYRPWHYREKIEKIHAALPTAAIGADVMAGFPGETDAEFEETRSTIEELPFTYLHVFTYSPRPGTPAAGMSKQVPVHVARERNCILRDLAAQKKLAFMRSFVGKTLEAITLKCGANAPLRAKTAAREEQTVTEALTDNYLKLALKGHHEPNRWITARVETVASGMLRGELA